MAALVDHALFVSEIILGSMAMEIFGPLVFSSVIATLTVRQFIGTGPIYDIPTFRLDSNLQIIPHLVLGLLAGLLAPWFLRLLRGSEHLFSRLNWPVYLKMALGGLIVGVLATGYPGVCGNGYSSVNGILHGEFIWQTLLGLLFFKMIATSATFGSGAVGGVFTPTLFVGASFGWLFGALFQHFVSATANPSAFALVGMGAFLAATTHAPIMAILMLFETTLDYQIILPLMLACVVAYYSSFSIEKRSIYAESLARKGAGNFRERLAGLRVVDLMKPDPPSVPEAAQFQQIAENFLAHRFNNLYVVGDTGRFQGVISLHDIKNFLNQPDLAEMVIARDILREEFPTIFPHATLAEALDTFSRHRGERLPVVSEETGRKLIGSISKSDLILAVAEQARQKETIL
jgi:CIC family chloride channel protein